MGHLRVGRVWVRLSLSSYQYGRKPPQPLAVLRASKVIGCCAADRDAELLMCCGEALAAPTGHRLVVPLHLSSWLWDKISFILTAEALNSVEP